MQAFSNGHSLGPHVGSKALLLLVVPKMTLPDRKPRSTAREVSSQPERVTVRQGAAGAGCAGGHCSPWGTWRGRCHRMSRGRYRDGEGWGGEGRCPGEAHSGTATVWGLPDQGCYCFLNLEGFFSFSLIIKINQSIQLCL